MARFRRSITNCGIYIKKEHLDPFFLLFLCQSECVKYPAVRLSFCDKLPSDLSPMSTAAQPHQEEAVNVDINHITLVLSEQTIHLIVVCFTGDIIHAALAMLTTCKTFSEAPSFRSLRVISSLICSFHLTHVVVIPLFILWSQFCS